jgi:Cu(I)/Ag(I) efflux system membrane protein CusA/SilA
LINRVIEFCARNRFLVFLVVVLLVFAGFWTMFHVPLDAIPDISDTQVIIFSKWMGRSPDLVEDQVTYPIVTALLSAPRVKSVRGFSDFSMSYVYVIFEDGTDVYWARSRVLEYLSKIQGTLPPDVKMELGPDGTPVGWVFQYALVDKTGKHDLAELRTLQEWYIRYALQSVEGVAEVANLGGFVRQYQVNVDPNKLLGYNIPLSDVIQKIRESNLDVGGRLLEFGGAEYMVRGRGYIKSLDDLRMVAVGVDPMRGTPILLRDVATSIEFGPDIRRGIAEWNGEGEVVGGIVVMRYHENALRVIDRVKEKLEEIKPLLPEGVEIVTAYDRSQLIRESIGTLTRALTQEMIIVGAVIILFLFHFRSALVPIITLPIAVILAFIPMYFLRVTSNIMSLGGIAIAIGVLVDASIVMVENAYRHVFERQPKTAEEQNRIVVAASKQVGRAIFFTLLIIVVSFLPVFLLEAQEGRLFRPLAYTKTFSMLFSSVLAITLVPILMVWLVRGKLRPQDENPVTRVCNRVYQPVIEFVLRHKWPILITNFGILPLAIPMILMLGREFMPPLREGSLLYMPTTAPGLSVTEAGKLLQVQDKILMTFPEVETVFGKAGRAETSTDPAPFSMMETTIILKPKKEWRRGMTYEKLIAEMDAALQLPGQVNAWTMPIRNRIDMLATGIRTPVGIKIFGKDLKTIEEIGKKIETALENVRGTRSVYAERVTGGYYVDVKIKRDAIARYGLTVNDVQMMVESAIGGLNISTTVEGRERYPINVRYARELRDDIDKLQRVLVPVMSGMGENRAAMQIPLAQLADIELVSGPAMIRNEDGMLAGYVFVDVANRDIGGYVDDAKRAVKQMVEPEMPAGYYLGWSGQYEYQQRVKQRLTILLPVVLLVIFVLLYLTFHSALEASIVMLSVVYAMFGGVFLQWILHLITGGYHFSVAVWVGYIALYGVAVETGVVMVVYLHEALDKRLQKGSVTEKDIHEATVEGSVLRLRPKLMTVTTTILALTPLMWATGTGSDVMKPIAVPMIGGMITSTVHVLVITPIIFALMKEAALRRGKLKASEMSKDLIA